MKPHVPQGVSLEFRALHAHYAYLHLVPVGCARIKYDHHVPRAIKNWLRARYCALATRRRQNHGATATTQPRDIDATDKHVAPLCTLLLLVSKRAQGHLLRQLSLRGLRTTLGRPSSQCVKHRGNMQHNISNAKKTLDALLAYNTT